MSNENNSLGDTKAYQATLAIYNRIRSAIETIAYRQKTLVNLTRQVQGFIPLLKRTDKDQGGLPFYSKAYTSQKTNREHCLMCVLSFLVQEYWDYKESIEEFGGDRLKNLEVQLTLLEAIATDGLLVYRVTGKFPSYHLVTKTELDDEEAKERCIEALKQEQLKDDEEDYQAAVDHETGADLGDSEDAGEEDIDEYEADRNLSAASSSTAYSEGLTGAKERAAAILAEHRKAQDDAGEPYPDQSPLIEKTEEREDNIEGGIVGGGSVFDSHDHEPEQCSGKCAQCDEATTCEVGQEISAEKNTDTTPPMPEE